MWVLAHLEKKRFRFARIDTPETYGVKKDSEEYVEGKKSTERLRELIEGKDFIIKTVKDKKGSFRRYLCEIYVDEGNVGAILVKEGLAKYKDY